jgi:hypothetical protein
MILALAIPVVLTPILATTAREGSARCAAPMP